MTESEDFDAAISSKCIPIVAPRWRFSLRRLFILTTILAVFIAIIANYPLLALFLAGVASTLLFLQLAVFFAAVAVPGFWRLLYSFQTGEVGAEATVSDER